MVKENEIITKIVKQADRITITIPANDKPRFEKLIGKPIRVTIEAL